MNQHEVKLKVLLQPQGQPLVRVQLGQQCQRQKLEHVKEFEFAVTARQSVTLEIELLEKNNLDANTAVSIERIEIYSISDPRFIWAGIYRPDYPEPWASQQRQCGRELLPCLSAQSFLGWGGLWSLEITVPVFVWMHKQLNLGLIYT